MLLYTALQLSGSGIAFATTPEGEARFQERIRPLLKTYCADCHSGDAKEGNLSFDQFASTDDAIKNLELWWKVLKNLRANTMPPDGESRPTPAELETIAQWVKFDVFGILPDDPDPGRISARRLNRREYGNTVNDLLGIKFDAALVFPPDDSGYGFDNVGDALSFSPLLMEKYLRAAQTVVDQAVPKVTWITPYLEFRGRDFTDENGKTRGEDLRPKSPAKVKRTFKIKEAGKYAVQVGVKLHGSFDFDPARYIVTFCIDGQERSKNEYGWDEHKLLRSQYAEDWQPGEHELTFELAPAEKPADNEDRGAVGVTRDSTFVRFEIDSVRLEGPAGTPRRFHPKNYAAHFPREEPPTSAEQRREYAAEILRKFAASAFRGPVDNATVNRLVNMAESIYQQEGKTFEAGIAQAMVGVLASPRFLFRLESTAAVKTDEPFPPVDERALATRLSYFLWSTMPDDELFRLAEGGELRKQLPQQVARMMRDDRAKEFVLNFTGQWLRTRDVTEVSIDPLVILGHQEEFANLVEQRRGFRRQPFNREPTPEELKIRVRFRELRGIQDRFNEDLKRAMRRETELCVDYIVKEDRSLLDLLDCDYTFVNDKLAEHYGIPNVKGTEMRRVTLPAESPRGGVLTHGSMLLVTSNPTRTSPVKRGLFVLDNILGTPSPPAPAGVPDLEESAKKFAGREPPLRELLAAHRESALCSSCHSRMDPLGIALENFNALGMWRETEKDLPIDASGKLITGEAFKNVRELKKILRERHAEDFYRCVTGKMLTYALGRGLEYTDEQTVDLIVERLKQNDGKFSALLAGVIDSAPFQKQRNPAKFAAAANEAAKLAPAAQNAQPIPVPTSGAMP